MLKISSNAALSDPADHGPDESRLSWASRSFGRLRSLGPLFLATVVVPTLVAVLYFGLAASDVYISESKFVVRSPEKPASTALGGLLKSVGFSNAGDEIFAAQEYLVSRDALRALNNDEAFRQAYSQPSLSVFNRFGSWLTGGDTFEDLYRYFKKRVTVQHEAVNSITTLTVRAYTPQDAQRFNEQLLEMAENTVNRLNLRGREDLIRFADAEAEEARRLAREAALAVSVYRNRAGVIDPERQATVQLQMISKLQDELIASRTQLLQLRTLAPRNPQIEMLETKVGSLTRAIDEETGKVVGGQRSLSSAVAQYQRLVLDSQFAEKQLAAAMTSLQDARNEARRKQAYVERIVQPNTPDDPAEPRRLRGIFATFVVGLVSWGILSMLIAGIREHRD